MGTALSQNLEFPILWTWVCQLIDQTKPKLWSPYNLVCFLIFINCQALIFPWTMEWNMWVSSFQTLQILPESIMLTTDFAKSTVQVWCAGGLCYIILLMSLYIILIHFIIKGYHIYIYIICLKLYNYILTYQLRLDEIEERRKNKNKWRQQLWERFGVFRPQLTIEKTSVANVKLVFMLNVVSCEVSCAWPTIRN